MAQQKTDAKQETQPTKAQTVANDVTKALATTAPDVSQGVAEFNNPQDGTEVTAEQVWGFIKENAGGNPNNVLVAPLSNVNPEDTKPTPFGYARPDGTRAMFHNWHVKGYVPADDPKQKPDFRLGNMLDQMRKVDGHSRQRMICTIALLNGGYSRSSKTWGTPFIKLVALPPPQQEQPKEGKEEQKEETPAKGSKTSGKQTGGKTSSKAPAKKKEKGTVAKATAKKEPAKSK